MRKRKLSPYFVLSSQFALYRPYIFMSLDLYVRPICMYTSHIEPYILTQTLQPVRMVGRKNISAVRNLPRRLSGHSSLTASLFLRHPSSAWRVTRIEPLSAGSWQVPALTFTKPGNQRSSFSTSLFAHPESSTDIVQTYIHIHHIQVLLHCDVYIRLMRV